MCWSDPPSWCYGHKKTCILRSTLQNRFEHDIVLYNVISLLVVSFPELDGTDVGGDEDGTAQEGVEGSREDGRDYGLDKKHGRIWRNSGQGSLKQLCFGK